MPPRSARVSGDTQVAIRASVTRRSRWGLTRGEHSKWFASLAIISPAVSSNDAALVHLPTLRRVILQSRCLDSTGPKA